MAFCSVHLYSQAVIYTLNSGADYQPAGPLYLAGGVSSYRTALPEEIHTFEKFKVQNKILCNS